MNDVDKLIQNLIIESIKQEEVTLSADSKKMSQQSTKLYKIKQKLRNLGIEACERMLPLLNDPNNYVRFNVALVIIQAYPEEARKTLLEISKLTGTIAFRAEIILQERDNRNLKF